MTDSTEYFPLLPHNLQQGGFLLKQIYSIQNDKSTVGSAEVYDEGLYYRIVCRCGQVCKHPNRIFVSGCNGTVDLGICLYDESGFYLRTRIPKKRIGGNNLSFYLSGPEKNGTVFIPLDTDFSFPYLSKLKNARFAVKDGKAGVEICEA